MSTSEVSSEENNGLVVAPRSSASWECLPRRYLRSRLEVQSKLRTRIEKCVCVRRTLVGFALSSEQRSAVVCELCELRAYSVSYMGDGNYCRLAKTKFVLLFLTASVLVASRNAFNIWTKHHRDEEHAHPSDKLDFQDLIFLIILSASFGRFSSFYYIQLS